MNRDSPTTAGWGLGARLFVSQALAHLASVLTVGVVAVIVGPPLFHIHLMESGHLADSPEMPHIERAFTDAGLVSLGVGLVVALVLSLAVAWYVTRRIRTPVGTLTDAALRMSAGDYGTRVSVTGPGSELATLGDSFNRMAARLGTVEETRRRLLADLAHEMRTPVATLNAYLEAIADGVTPWDDSTRAILEHQAERLSRLARDLDDVSRAEEGRVSLDPSIQSLAALIDAAVGQVRQRYDADGVQLTRQVVDTEVRVDPQRISQVLGNLLGNALRHTPRGGTVTITAALQRRRATIRVTDTGEGMSDEQLSHIFERFYRGETARERDKAGSGIGLTIARALAEAHGGTLTATSPGPGLGSTFTLTLPLEQRPTG
ncbi:ATP-binding protein [Raineyella sp. W15-4]|uniref:ATP-binding protein n=1 Tax=Raineyella sp. W15-4 TaxID=3081651 RepID=UPI00295532E8|nr:ATP-binding protein [Raineyella sp. W15-4]WOQ16688.1 ATP-binding protein [Raineyella sp. W15-4]